MRSFNGSSYLRTTAFNGGVHLGAPLSISAWFVPRSTGIGRVAQLNSASGTSVTSSILTNYPAAGNVSNQWYGSNNYGQALNKAGVNTLNHALAVTGTVKHWVWLNGIKGVTQNTTGSVSNCTYFEIGRQDGQQYFTGLVGHVAVWNAELTDEEAKRLYAGHSPLTVCREKLLEYWPLRDNDLPVIGRAGSYLSIVSSPTWDARQAPLPPLMPQRRTTATNRRRRLLLGACQ